MPVTANCSTTKSIMKTAFTATSLHRLPRTLSALLMLVPLAHANAGVSDLVDKNWIEIDSPHFRVVTEQPEHVGRQMIVDLENLRYISNRVRGAQSMDGPPLTIVAIGKSSFRALRLPENWGGAFSLSRHGYAALASLDQYATSSDENNYSRATLLHEYHHFLMHFSPETTSYPTWYDEGMSEYWSSLVIQDGMAWFGKGIGRERSLRDASGDATFNTKWLFSSPRLTFDDEPANVSEVGWFYSQSSYAIHYFNSSPELRRQLADYLRLHNMGLSQERAVQLAFKKSYAELNDDLLSYIHHDIKVRGFSIGKDGLALPQVQVKVTKLDRPAIYAILADVVPHFGKRDNKASRELIETNLKLHPDDVNANTIAVTFDAVDDADTRLPALLQRYPNDARLLAAHAERLRRRALGMHDTGVPGWEPLLLEARALHRRAIKADSNTSLAYYGLGYLYTLLPGSEPVQEGIAGLDTAVIYEPTPDCFRALARLYLRDKQLRNALTSMRSAVAFDTRGKHPVDVVLMENLEILAEMNGDATPDAKGLRYKSGSVYEGTLADGKPHGKGKWSDVNGSYYEGDFVHGLPSGHGRLVSERGAVYEGDFLAGMAHGKGRMTFPETSKVLSYEGGVNDAVPDGPGVLVTKDGRLETTFLQGEAHGDGIFTPARGGAPLKGKWFYGGYQWLAADNIVFTGGIDAKGRRDGYGWCRAGASTKIEDCRYKDDRKIALDADVGD
jgi:hypothetical protein